MYVRALLVLLLVGCGSSRSADRPDAGPPDSPDAPSATFTVGGVVSGLVSDGLVLANNGGDALAISSDGTFVFATPVASGAQYDVTIMTQPHGEICTLAGGTGAVANANVVSVAVTCQGATVSLGVGAAGTCAVHSDGTLWCWGYGPFPTGGLCYPSSAFVPKQIGTDTNWAGVVSGGQFYFLRTDHSLWWFGQNCDLTQFGTITDWIEVAASRNAACGIRADGTLWCWSNGTAPTQQGTDTTWAHVSTSDDHTCGTHTDGTLWCEGTNNDGELGVGDTSSHGGLVQVAGTWKQVSAARARSTCAIRDDDTLWCWGYNSWYLIDTQLTQHASAPIQRFPGTWLRIDLGLNSACATRANGSVACWGSNARGILGAGDDADHDTIVDVHGGHVFGFVAPGGDYACGLALDHTVWCWGNNFDGSFASGIGQQELVPTQGAGSWLRVSEHGPHGCGIRDDRSLWCWGANFNGELGTGDSSNRALPWPVASGTTWLDLAAGDLHTCAVRDDGTLWCWGDGASNQLGSTIAETRAPIQVGAETTWSALFAGAKHTCGLRGNPGTLWCWGDNTHGQLGHGTTAVLGPPEQVGADSDWVSVAGGTSHTCALKNNGTAWCWGLSTTLALGSQPACTDCTTPIQVGTGTTWKTISAYADYTLATRDDGTLWRWGTGPGMVSSPTPMQIATGATWARASAGAEHACALRGDTTLACWGNNDYGELGTGAPGPEQDTPVTTSPLQAWTSLAAGTDGTCALRTDHSLWCWGVDNSGQLGLDEAWHDVPTIVP
jgi:alpha-tubulin suppressor-like RCC1 family protein